jgi:hypothetical protein
MSVENLGSGLLIDGKDSPSLFSKCPATNPAPLPDLEVIWQKWQAYKAFRERIHSSTVGKNVKQRNGGLK